MLVISVQILTLSDAIGLVLTGEDKGIARI